MYMRILVIGNWIKGGFLEIKLNLVFVGFVSGEGPAFVFNVFVFVCGGILAITCTVILFCRRGWRRFMIVL